MPSAAENHKINWIGNMPTLSISESYESYFQNLIVGLTHCQACNEWKLDSAFNALFTSVNVDKVTMKKMGMKFSMSSFKSLLTNTYIVNRIFKACGYNPNRT